MCDWAKYNHYNELCSDKLAHYNAWLADHEFGTPYPGFPRQDELNALTGRENKIVVLNAPKPETKEWSEPKTTNHKTGTKLERAIELYKMSSDKSRDTIVSLFMVELDMTKAGATTYFFNCRKKFS